MRLNRSIQTPGVIRPIVGRPMFSTPLQSTPRTIRPMIISPQIPVFDMAPPSLVRTGGDSTAVEGKHPGVIDDVSTQETPFYKKPAVLIGGAVLIAGIIYFTTRKKRK